MKSRNSYQLQLAAIALVVIFAATAFSASPKPARGGGWIRLGSAQASFKSDHDVIVVKGPADNFRAIKFKVTDASLNLHRLVVNYDSGKPERLEVRENIPQGGESRPINLKGGKRSLKSVEFWYDTKGEVKGKADVTLFGRH